MKQKILRAEHSYSINEVGLVVKRYQQSPNEADLHTIIDAVTPIILKFATKHSKRSGKDMREVVSDYIQLLVEYIPKYKAGKYHFLQSFKSYLGYNKNLCVCYKPERVPIKLTDTEKKKNIKDLNAKGISKSRNGKTFYAKMDTIDISEAVINKMGVSTDLFKNKLSIVYRNIGGDCRAYLELVIEGYSQSEIIRMYRTGKLAHPKDVDNIEEYINKLKDIVREQYRLACDMLEEIN